MNNSSKHVTPKKWRQFFLAPWFMRCLGHCTKMVGRKKNTYRLWKFIILFRYVRMYVSLFNIEFVIESKDWKKGVMIYDSSFINLTTIQRFYSGNILTVPIKVTATSHCVTPLITPRGLYTVNHLQKNRDFSRKGNQRVEGTISMDIILSTKKNDVVKSPN